MEDPSSLSDKETSFQAKTINSDANKNQEYLVMTVEIGDGRTDVIAIHEDDDPSILAQEFASKHNLDISLQKSLSNLIRQNKELVEKKTNVDADIENWSDWNGSNHQSQPFGQSDMFTPKINEKSRKMLQKFERRGTVYERLYQKSRKNNEAKELTKTLDVSNKSKSTNSINYGEWLYVRGMKMKEAAKKTLEEKKRQQIEKDLKDATFAPTINRLSSLMSPRYFEKPEEILYKKAEASRQKLELMKQQNEENKLKECRFVPQINPSARPREPQVHELLYKQAEQKKAKLLQKRETQIKQYPFTPNVALTKKKDPESSEPVHERLLSGRKRFETDLDDLRKASVIEYDAITGQKLFRPVTESHVEPRTEPVWEQLYSKDKKQKKERAEILTEEKRFWEANASAQKTTENTQKIFQEFREKQYEKIFNLLDSDKDGLISASSIELQALDVRTLEILQPVFEAIEADKVEVDLKRFLQFMEIIGRSLNVDDRAYLIKREDRKPKEVEEPGRMPYVSPASVKLANKSRQDLSENIYERLVNASKITEMRLKKDKELQEMFALKDCTFKPDLNKH